MSSPFTSSPLRHQETSPR